METAIWARDLPLLLAEAYAKVSAVSPSDPEKRLIDLVEWLSRIPTRYPRRVHVSDVLRHSRLLTPYEIGGVRCIRDTLMRGHDLRPFLGKRTGTIRNRLDEKRNPRLGNDLFFADWGLHHFHLGADMANTGRSVMRSRRVLIALLAESDAYLLDVTPHGKGFPDIWGRKEYLEILHRNWPEVLGRYELHGILPPNRADKFQAKDYIQLRQKGVTTIVEVAGKAFMGPGLGIASDGSSTRAVVLADRIRDELDAGEALFRAQHPDGDALLFVGKDASVGFFVAEKDTAFSVYSGRDNQYNVTSFFQRLISETGIYQGVPDGAIWTVARSVTN